MIEGGILVAATHGLTPAPRQPLWGPKKHRASRGPFAPGDSRPPSRLPPPSFPSFLSTENKAGCFSCQVHRKTITGGGVAQLTLCGTLARTTTAARRLRPSSSPPRTHRRRFEASRAAAGPAPEVRPAPPRKRMPRAGRMAAAAAAGRAEAVEAEAPGLRGDGAAG